MRERAKFNTSKRRPGNGPAEVTMDKADCALIGGSPAKRLFLAVLLRSQGVSCFCELTNRKPDRMLRRAVSETWRGRAGVANVDDHLEFETVAARALDFNASKEEGI